MHRLVVVLIVQGTLALATLVLATQLLAVLADVVVQHKEIQFVKIVSLLGILLGDLASDHVHFKVGNHFVLVHVLHVPLRLNHHHLLLRLLNISLCVSLFNLFKNGLELFILLISLHGSKSLTQKSPVVLLVQFLSLYVVIDTLVILIVYQLNDLDSVVEIHLPLRF